MRQFSTRVTLLIWLLSSSCNTEEINRTCADPIGSDDLECTGNQTFFCFQSDMNACFAVYLNDPDYPQFPVIIQSVYFAEGKAIGMIANYGEVPCISSMKRGKPLDFVYAVAGELHHGYVVRFPDETFGRLIVESIDQNINGQVTQVNITLHYAY
jgi:hypothetical protein